MPHRPHAVEVESLADLDRLLAQAPTSLAGWVLQGLDLRARGPALAVADPRGALFLGCALDADVEQLLRDRGAVLFPTLPHVPVHVYRSRLYTPGELYDGLGTGYAETLDARVYAWTREQQPGLQDLLARSLHDLSIDDALEELAADRRLVGVMGGHATARGSAGYRDAAALGRSLTRAGLTVATGGGPGAMEAANLGAYLAEHPEDVLADAVDLLAAVPDFAPSVSAWAGAAFDVRRRWPGGSASVGVPTWFYGHEPPNAFAGHIAKYFTNAIREHVLLHVCTAGIVFLPGRAGTVQEVFQDACENYYADPSQVAPMVLVGADYWTREVPAWPLLSSLGAGRDMAGSVHLVDDPTEVVALLGG